MQIKIEMNTALMAVSPYALQTVTALPSEPEPYGQNRTLQLVQECYESYHKRVSGQTKEGISQLQDFLQGTVSSLRVPPFIQWGNL